MSRKVQWAIVLFGLLVAGGVGSYVAGPLLRGQAPSGAPGAVREPYSFREVAKKVLPAVVSIETRTKPQAAPRGNRAKPQAAPRGRPQLPDNIPEEFRQDRLVTSALLHKYLAVNPHGARHGPEFLACTPRREMWLVRWPNTDVKWETRDALVARGLTPPDVPVLGVVYEP